MKSLLIRGEGIKIGVYRIYTSVSNKVYIGSSFCSFSNRYHLHLKELNKNVHGCKKMQNAYNKYGADNFYFEIIEQYDKSQFVSKQEMIKFILSREQFYLDKYPTELKYNIVQIAGTNAGFQHSDDFKAKKSKQMKGRPQHPNTLSAIIAANTGKPLTINHKKKISDYWKGKKKSKSSIEKRISKTKGKTFKNRRTLLLCNLDYTVVETFNNDEKCANYLNCATSTVRIYAANCRKIKEFLLMYDRYPIVNNRIKTKKNEK